MPARGSLSAAPLSGFENIPFCRAIILILLGILVVYGNSLRAQWHYDDILNIVENPAIQISSLDWDALWKAALEGHQQSPRIARPLAYLSFALNHLYGGLDVVGYHVVNLGIHITAAVILFLLIRTILQLPRLAPIYESSRDAVALLAAMFWALHPINVTAVTYIVQRMASMAALFYLLAIYCYLKARLTKHGGLRWLLFISCGVAGLAGFFSKENVAMLPISLLAVEIYLLQPPDTKLPPWQKRAAILVACLFFFWGTYKLTAGGLLSGYERRSFTLVERLLTQPRILIFYLSLWAYPTGSRLMLLHDPILSTGLLNPWTTLPALVMMGGGVWFSITMRRRFPLACFSLAFFLLNHLIESSILPLELIYEHRNYLPMAFLNILSAVWLLKGLTYFKASRVVRPLMVLLIVGLITGNGISTYLYNEVLRTDLSLWLNNAAKTPHLSVAQNNLANIMLDIGKTEEAVPILKTAIEQQRFNNTSQISVVYYNLGRAYERIYGLRDPKTVATYQASRKANPQHFKSLIKIAMHHQAEGRFAEAENLLLASTPSTKGLKEIAWRNSLSLAQLKQGKCESAYANALRVLAAQPDAASPKAVIAEINRRWGRKRMAIRWWESALHKDPSHLDALLALTVLYFQRDKSEKTAPMIRRIMGARPDSSFDEILAERRKRAELSAWTVDYGLLRSIYLEFLTTQQADGSISRP
jgi:tetratricopeptide (TPR) repeat protein